MVLIFNMRIICFCTLNFKLKHIISSMIIMVENIKTFTFLLPFQKIILLFASKPNTFKFCMIPSLRYVWNINYRLNGLFAFYFQCQNSKKQLCYKLFVYQTVRCIACVLYHCWTLSIIYPWIGHPKSCHDVTV